MEKVEVDFSEAAETNLQWEMTCTFLIKILDLKKGS